MWTTERPSRVEYFIGNEKSRKELTNWFKQWIRGIKPLLLLGPPGVGKTSMIHTLSIQYDLDLIELNASDTRNRLNLYERIIPLLENSSLLGKKFLLFLDEVDGLSGREDSGAIEFLSAVMKESSIPVILAANEINHITRNLSKVCKVVSFRNIPPRLSLLYLNHFLRTKNFQLSPGDKFSIVRTSSGDIRKMLNDAQARISGYSGSRENYVNMDIEDAIDRFFSSTDAENANDLILSSDTVFRDTRFGISTEDRRKDLIYGFYSSIVTSKLDSKTMAEVLDELSRIDALLGRSMEKRNWRVLKYLPCLITYAIFPHTRLKQLHYNRYSIGFQYMGNIFMRALGLRNALLSLSKDFHVSKSNFGSFILPFMLRVLGKNLESEMYIRHSLLDDKSVAALGRETKRAATNN